MADSQICYFFVQFPFSSLFFAGLLLPMSSPRCLSIDCLHISSLTDLFPICTFVSLSSILSFRCNGRAHMDILNPSISLSVSLTPSLPFCLSFPSILFPPFSTPSSPFLPIFHFFGGTVMDHRGLCSNHISSLLSLVFHNQPLFLSPLPWKYLFSPRASHTGRHPSFPLSSLEC